MASFKNAVSANVGTGETTLLTATAVTTLIGMTIANVTGSMITVDVKLTTGAGTAYVVKSAPIMPGGSLIVVGGEQKVVLEIGDAVSVTSSAATSADVICSYLEV
jgi:5,10-methenyltetrahydromethanopterin hydrogenase